MIAGHFDLSVGTIVGLTGWAMYYFGNVLGLPPIATILCALAFGALLGAINGILQVRTGLPSFIITLATPLVHRGLLHDGDERLSSRSQVSRRLRADDRRQASVWLPHVAAVVPRGRAAGDAVPAAHPHGQLGLRNRAEPHRGQEFSACRSPAPR